jgi:hypothetical protein
VQDFASIVYWYFPAFIFYGTVARRTNILESNVKQALEKSNSRKNVGGCTVGCHFWTNATQK